MHGWLSVWAYVKHKVKKIAYKHSYLYRSLNHPPPKNKITFAKNEQTNLTQLTVITKLEYL